MSGRRSWLTAIALLIIITAVVTPSLAYRESQFELRCGNLLVQNQSYSTIATQKLFHTQTAAGTDTEAFAFAPAPGGGFNLAQSSSGDVVATDTGFYTATFSFLKFSSPTAEGYLHTSIGDPLVSNTPVFSSLIFPGMIQRDKIGNPGSNVPVVGSNAGASMTPKNDTTQHAATGTSAFSGSENMTSNNLTTIAPLLKKQISSTQVGVADTTNIMAVTPAPSPQPTPAPAGKAANITGAASPTPTPAAEPPYAVLPKSTTLLTKPMSRQSNKPFMDPMDPDYNPRKATRSQVSNISGWDRFTTNVIGRSGIDSTYMNRTSSPSYINPWNVVKLADQFKVMSDSRNMTRSGSYLQPRLWAL